MERFSTSNSSPGLKRCSSRCRRGKSSHGGCHGWSAASTQKRLLHPFLPLIFMKKNKKNNPSCLSQSELLRFERCFFDLRFNHNFMPRSEGTFKLLNWTETNHFWRVTQPVENQCSGAELCLCLRKKTLNSMVSIDHQKCFFHRNCVDPTHLVATNACHL